MGDSVAVVGPGSVGVFFAAHLAAVGRDVIACARRPFDEYVVDSEVSPVRHPAHVVLDPGELHDGPVDWVLVTVKAHQTQGASPWLARLCGPNTVVVVIQNGIEGEERVQPFAGSAEVVPGTVYCGVELQEPGHVTHYASSHLFVPVRPSNARLQNLFHGTPIKIIPAENYLTETWRKLGVNCAFNGVHALTRRRFDVMGDPGVADVSRRVLAEAWAVAAACGAELSADDVDPLIDAVVASKPRGATSMFYDRMAGRPTEHDALYGCVVRAGRRVGVPTPLHEVFDALLAAGDDSPAHS